MSIKKTLFGLSAAAVALSLAGCAAVPVLMASAVGTTAAVSTDRRTVGAQVSDSVMERRILIEVEGRLKEGVHLTVTCYNRWVLLTGEVTTEEKKQMIGQIAQSSLEVQKVFNQLEVMEPVSYSQRFSDSSLATKIRTSIIGTSGIYLNQLKIVVDRGNVYIMGMVTKEEADILVDKISHTSGVASVVKVFEVLTREEIDKRMELLKGAEYWDAQSQDGKKQDQQQENKSEVWLN